MDSAALWILVPIALVALAIGLVLWSGHKARGQGPWNDVAPEDAAASEVALRGAQGIGVAAVAVPAVATVAARAAGLASDLDAGDLERVGDLAETFDGGRSGGGGGQGPL